MKRKLISIITAMSLILSVSPITSFADSNSEYKTQLNIINNEIKFLQSAYGMTQHWNDIGKMSIKDINEFACTNQDIVDYSNKLRDELVKYHTPIDEGLFEEYIKITTEQNNWIKQLGIYIRKR